MSEAEKFLKTSNLASRFRVDEETKEFTLLQSDVIYLIEKYHQNKVNNVVLDDVNVCSLSSTEKRLASAEWSRERSAGDRQQDRDSYYDYYCGMEKAVKIINER
jgi:hypothetical protein